MKKIFPHIFLLFLFTLIAACSDNSSSNDNDEEDISVTLDSLAQDSLAQDSLDLDSLALDSIEKIPDYLQSMLLVKGDSSNVMLGTNNKSAQASEKPEMKVILDYDFYMGRHEVSCGEYAATLKKEKRTAPKCDNDSLPIVDITYYDAILWTNAKSKSEKLDSVYDYSKATYDDEGHCSYISGLIFHPERNGFRLPTEAEWIKAASINWDSTNSWNNGNSGYKLHNICSLDKDSTQFCDLAGNAMEWVNDWLGYFKDTTITNYVGASDGGDLEERILKGGSFNTDVKSTNRYSRGDVYTVTSSTRAEYVGFRVAFGAITNPIWLSSNGTLQESIVSALATPSEIYAYTKTYNVKMAFRNDVSENLNFIDYSTGTMSVTEIADTISVYHPEISPNGEHVAFCTGLEGVSGTSSVYVRDLNQEGSNLVKLNVKSAAIPRWNVLDNGDTVIIYVTNAGNNKDSSNWTSYSTWQVPFANGEFGTPVKLFNGSFHGGISSDNRLTITGARILRARIADNSSTLDNDAKNYTWYNGEQACNASLAKDNSKRTAFLDFGGKTGRNFVGESYRTHERLLIADSTGKLIQSVGSPSGYTFDHSEWAVGSVKDNIVATLTNSDGAHQKITLVNLKDSSMLDLAEGDELWHPSFWIEKKEVPVAVVVPADTTSGDSLEESLENVFLADPDSAGAYYTSNGNYIAARWRYKLELLWQYKDTADIVILGSSRSLFGVNSLLFSEPHFAINLSNTSNIKHGSKYIFHNYVIPHVKNLKYVIISMDFDRWYHDDPYSFFYSTYKSFPGYIYDENHNFWKDSIPADLFQRTYESLGWAKYGTPMRTNRGYQTTGANGWEQESVPIDLDSTWLEQSDTIFNKHYQYLKDIIVEAEEHNVTVIGVEFPESPAYRNTGSYGKYGIKRSQMPMIFEKIQQLHNEHPNFIFVDENKMGEHDYTDEMAQNADHLATPGAKIMTARLDSILTTLSSPADTAKQIDNQEPTDSLDIRDSIDTDSLAAP